MLIPDESWVSQSAPVMRVPVRTSALTHEAHSSTGPILLRVRSGPGVDAPHSGADVRAEAFPATVGAPFGGLAFVGATRP
jgi:hypothetical protein